MSQETQSFSPQLVSESFSKIFEALAKAQGEFPPIEKNSKVEVYSKPPERKFLYEYYYADLTEIINKTRPALSKHGISFTQGMGSFGFYTKLMHSSGECFESGIIPTQIKANDYKEMAGAITYLKRISLSAALGISADEDVDAAESEAKKGNSTTKTDKPKSGYTPKPKADTQPNKTSNPIDALLNTYKTVGVEKGQILDYFGYIEISQITPKDVEKLREVWKQIVAKEVSVIDLFMPPIMESSEDDFDQYMHEHQ